jgi:uncharacterized protein YbbK (DUF523 family)/uncharacterized protein YbgA (DUF1722 family)
MTSLKNERTSQEIRIGISRCLLGEEVRYDGGHKRDEFITRVFGRHFTWVPVCPEMEIGLGSPRESMKLLEINGDVHLVTNETGRDFTGKMNRYASRRTKQLSKENLHGFILKKDSPSCGIFRVKVYKAKGSFQKRGRGLFAETLLNRFPNLPVEDEERLQDLSIRENFIERVFAYFRWTQFLKSNPRIADFISFHTHQKMAILAHSRTHYQQLGQLVAGAKKLSQGILDKYESIYQDAFKQVTTNKKHANVLYHLAGHFKKTLDGADRAEIIRCIEEYRNGFVRLSVPLQLLQHHLKQNSSRWIREQSYLNPYPAELKLILERTIE